jgi:cysteine desulfurase
VLEPIERLEQEGFRVTQLPVDARGHVDLAALRAAITDSTVLVSLMAANNEIGTLHPVAEIGALCKQRGVLFHCDATQAAGRVPLDVHAFGIDLLSLSAHKMYGPKGVGALYVRRRSPRVRLAAQLDGGGHERGMRSGTLNVAGIVGFGEAARIAAAELATDQERIGILRDRLEAVLCDAVPDAVVHGDPAARLCHLTHVSFPGVAAEELLGEMREIAVSTGSACSSASRAPSHVLRAIGVPDELARCSIRFTLGRPTTADEIDSAAERVAAAVSSIRRRNAEYRKGKEPADRLA